MKRMFGLVTMVALLFGAISIVGAQEDNLLIGSWHWLGFQGGDDSVVSPDNPADYTVTFNDDMTVAVKADCNNAVGEYIVEGSQVSIVLGPMTLAMCPEGSLSDTFVSYLGDVVSFVIAEDGTLNLVLTMDVGSMSFIPAPMIDPMPPIEIENPLSGSWHWLNFTGGDGLVVSSGNPADYTVTFNDDMTVAVKADCNNAIGEYTIGGSQVGIVLGPVTLVACGESSLSNQFLDYLGDVVSFVIAEDGTLNLALMMDAGIMKFVPAPLVDPVPPVEANTSLETTWYWTNLNTAEGDVIIATPDLYVVTFAPDGVAIKADCNNLQGSYSYDETDISIEIGPMTRAMCAEDSLSDEFANLLGQVNFFTINGDDSMTMVTEDGSATLTLVNSAQLIQGSWQWSGAFNMDDSSMSVDNPIAYTVTFMDDGMVAVKADCNGATGEYTVDGNSIDIQMGAMTMVMCAEGSLSDVFVQALDQVISLLFENGNVYFALPMDGDIMEFTPALVGTTWLWEQTITPVEIIEVDQPMNYTVIFNDDGTVAVKADCNNASGVFTTTGTGISVNMGPMTLAMCPEGSLSDTFVQQLMASAIYFFEDGSLYIDLFADGGTMRFIAE